MEALQERRKQLVRLHRKGMGVMRIVEAKSMSHPVVRSAIDRFESGEIAATKPARSKAVGTTRVLNSEQEARFRALVFEKRPEPLKMEFAALDARHRVAMY